MGFQESENENENNGGLLHGTERCNGLFEALLAKFPSRQGNEYEVTLDSHRRFQAWIPRLHESLTYMVGDKGVLIRQLINSIEANLHCILEIRSHKTDQGTRHGAMEVLANDILSTVSNSVARLEDYTTAVGREFEQDGYSQRRAPPIIYDSLVIRGLILSRFPRLSESILRLLERSVVARREALLSLRNVRSAPGRGFEAVEDQDSSETESLSSVQSESWINYPYPAPPEGDGDAQTKRCDWCYNELEVSKLKNIAWWRKHFLGDLQPYVCLAGCEHPRMLFSKFDEWQDHMDFFHDEDWIKNLQQLDQSRCDATTFSSGGQEFDTSYELQTHKNVVQGGEAFWTQEDFILNRSVETSSIGLATCPLCHQHILIDGSIRGTIDEGIQGQSVYSKTDQYQESFVADKPTTIPVPISLEGPTSQELEIREILVRHIANDLKDIAFLSLKDIDGETLRGGSSNSMDGQKISNRISAEDNSSKMSLSVRTSGSPKLDIEILSNKNVSVRSESLIGAREASRLDNTDHVSWSRFSAFKLPNRRKEAHRPENEVLAAIGGHLTTQSSLAEGVLDQRDEDSVSSVATSSHLRDEINDSLVESAFDSGRRFLPEGSLDRLVTSENVLGVLTYLGANTEEIQSLVDFVLTKARKIFIVIVNTDMINVSDALESCRRSGVTDRHLPLPRELINCGGMKNHSTRKDCQHEVELEVFHEKPWRRSAISAFYHAQWQFLAPSFTPYHRDMTLDVRAILPFVHVGRDARVGFFSEVYEVELHRDHHNGIIPAEDGHELRVALKELRADSNNDDIRDTFEHEMRSFEALREFQHKHLITTMASIVRGERRYFIFPWADGEDLRAFWMTTEFWPLTPHLILETVQQLGGLASALYTLHQGGWRHGDVKPENILRFKDRTTLGILKLGDLGLAKTHHQSTALRQAPTTTRVGTMRYEPPETVVSNNQPRSRKYDIWSMGCVTMEFVIWLLYGPTGLNEFSRALSKDNTIGEAFYSTRQGDYHRLQAEVHPVVSLWMGEISKNPDWPRDSAIADLVRLVETHLLVVRTSSAKPPLSMIEQSNSEQLTITIGMDSQPDMSNVRADAHFLQKRLELILHKCQTDPEYLFPRSARAALYRRPIPGHKNTQTRLRTGQHIDILKPSALHVLAVPERLPLLSRAGAAEEYSNTQGNTIEDTWEYITDNDFASRFFQSFATPTTPGRNADRVCAYCTEIDFCVPEFSMSYTTKYLQETAPYCCLCSLLYNALTRNDPRQLDLRVIHFKRYDSIIKSQTSGSPILSMVSDPINSIASPTARLIPAEIQIGLPNLHDFDSAAHRHLLRQWLASCDFEHQCISGNKSNRYFPTRILFVEGDDAPTVRLIETITMVAKPKSYITLSYVWGSRNAKWRLNRSNYSQFQYGTPTSELPPSFRDAALVALQMGIPYLWIDALCVIHDGDLDTAADVMERDQAFRGSHCTVSLSSAVSINDGFLKPRRHREAVKMKRENGGIYYVCELIDEFSKDVEESPLSSRGWAFQERILSRRMIFFTANQTYWQCGEGIRCETLTKLGNWRSAILGDPDFPARSLKTLHPVQTYQQFYERYSLLRFSFATDRLLAFQGLEKRVLLSLKSAGGYGVVERFFHRSLLWRRGPEQTLERIEFPEEQHIPSWSWQAYIGGITYLEMPPDTIAWNKNCYTPRHDFSELIAEAWDFDFQAASSDESNNLTVVWDQGEHGRREDLKCITVGSSKASSDEIGPRSANYLLIVAPSGDHNIFERLGVGYMDGIEPVSRDKLMIRVR